MADPLSFELALESDRTIQGRIHLAPLEGPRPTVVVCHGFKGFMEWGFFPYLTELLADRGFTVVRFNFSGSGMQRGDELVTDFDAFRTATHSQDLLELNALLDVLGVDIAPDHVDRERIGLFGHSRGGGTAVLAAGPREGREGLRSLVTWSAVRTFDRLTEDQKISWRREGTFPITNARTGQELTIHRLVLDDLEEHTTHLDILAAARRCRVPWLIIHGQIDETVPAGEAQELADHSGATTQLEIIRGATHTFGATHPLSGPTPQLIEALNATQMWFRKTLTE